MGFDVTIECAGLLTGSTAKRVAEHVKVTWERGQQAIASVRTQLGPDADELLPLINGGVTMAKLRGAMHDTCNAANLVAKKVRGIRDDIGKEMYGEEEWAVSKQTAAAGKISFVPIIVGTYTLMRSHDASEGTWWTCLATAYLGQRHEEVEGCGSNLTESRSSGPFASSRMLARNNTKKVSKGSNFKISWKSTYFPTPSEHMHRSG
jgi:hypothetical protein